MTYRGRILAIAPLLGLLALVPMRASAATVVPFHASVFEHYTPSVCAPSTVCIEATGMGQATYMGEVTETATVRVDINPADAPGGCSPETRVTTLTAADGDSITMSATGCGFSATNSAIDSYVATGEGARLASVSGSGLDWNLHMLTGPGVGIAWVTFSGVLSSSGPVVSSH